MSATKKHRVVALYEHPTDGVIEICRIIETYPKTDKVNAIAQGNIRYNGIPKNELITEETKQQ